MMGDIEGTEQRDLDRPPLDRQFHRARRLSIAGLDGEFPVNRLPGRERQHPRIRHACCFGNELPTIGTEELPRRQGFFRRGLQLEAVEATMAHAVAEPLRYPELAFDTA